MKTVLFDFDFTLGDSSRAIVTCVRAGLREIGLPASPTDRIRDTIGLPLPDALVRLQGPQPSAAIERFLAAFHRRPEAIMAEQTRIYEGVPELLQLLRAAACRTGIVSTKRRVRIEEILVRNDLRSAVDLIVGSEDAPAPKPDPSGLLLARRRLEGDGQPAVYVGDHPVDARAAQAADMAFVAVLSGMHDAAAFAPFRPLAVLPGIEALPALLAQLPSPSRPL